MKTIFKFILVGMLLLACTLTDDPFKVKPQQQIETYAVDSYEIPITVHPNVSPTPNTGICYVDAFVLNLRNGPGTSYTVIDWLSHGTPLSPTEKIQGDWSEVTTLSGKLGWVKTKFCHGGVQ